MSRTYLVILHVGLLWLYNRRGNLLQIFIKSYKRIKLSQYFLLLVSILSLKFELSEPQHDKTNKVACATSEDEPGHPPCQIRVFAVHMKKAWVLSYPLSAQPRLIRQADAQAEPSLPWVYRPFSWFYQELIRQSC